MSFEGPDEQDYDNVRSLNAGYLTLLRREGKLRRGLQHFAEPLRRRLIELSPEQHEQLAATPFLLFSFQEADDRYWNGMLRESRDPGLFRSSGSTEVDMLVAAALGFVWQLSKHNPYALRLICGGTLYWCERIADLTFYRLLDAVKASGEVPSLRLADNGAMWHKLLDDGVSKNRRVRNAAQMAALQAVLTSPVVGQRRESWSVAAQTVRAPGLWVADGVDRSG